MLALPTLSLYIHIPWCVQKCPYCDFNSHAQPEVIPEQTYINCLLDDLRADLAYVQGRQLQSIFIGGGTPSLFSAEGIARLLNGVESLIGFAPDIEITLEANPGTFEAARFRGFCDAGVNRLSIGVQSFNAQHLKRLGRIHDAAQAKQAAQLAAELVSQGKLQSFNLDIMHGLPDQTEAEALDDLAQAIALQPPHISWYQLTIEPNTLFASKPPRLPDDDTLWDIYEQGHQRLDAAGYQQYEVSAYGQVNHRGQHNINYWRFGDYLGIGCGAHGKITLPNEARILRTEKVKHPRGYLDLSRSFVHRSWDVAPSERVFEFFMNQLRLLEPVPKQRFVALTGLALETAERALANSIQRGLVIDQGEYWQTSAQGRLYLNAILGELLEQA